MQWILATKQAHSRSPIHDPSMATRIGRLARYPLPRKRFNYFEGLNFRSLRVNPLFGNFRGIYFRCMLVTNDVRERKFPR